MIARTLALASTVLVLALSAHAQEPSAPKPEPAKPEPAKPEQAKPEQAKPDPAKTEQAKGEPAKAEPAATFSKEQLEQIVAPIALYPDSLLTQVMMAATYPLEIVEAARWMQKNPKITADKLEGALQKETWDPSVKSLCGFNDVLKRMNENLDWTQDLGDAFLGQQAEVMDAVQNMRRKAYDAGNLKSGKELTITEKPDKIIIIEAAKPEVIYVPTYYPTAVYGGWGYPYYYYPPMYPPAPAGGVWFGFAVGVVWGSAMWGGCNWGWGNTEVNIDIDRQNNFIDRTEVNPQRRQEVKDRASNRQGQGTGGRGNWQHDASHRKGVGYKDNKVAQKYGGSPGSSRVSKDQARGYGDRSSPGTARTGAATRDAARTQPSARPQPSTRPQPSSGASRAGGASPRTSGQTSGSFSGSRSPSLDRASSSRGSSSRGSMGSRGGGGRGGGRGR